MHAVLRLDSAEIADEKEPHHVVDGRVAISGPDTVRGLELTGLLEVPIELQAQADRLFQYAAELRPLIDQMAEEAQLLREAISAGLEVREEARVSNSGTDPSPIEANLLADLWFGQEPFKRALDAVTYLHKALDVYDVSSVGLASWPASSDITQA